MFYPEPNAHAKLRLLCFPYAGGRSSVFGGWQEWLPSEVELCCVQLPGRDANRFEPLFTSFDSLMEALVPVVGEACTLPLTFFGHSMGALICFEVARELRVRNWPSPVQMFLSGHRAPHQSMSETPLHCLPDAHFVRELQRRYGETQDFLQSPELTELFLPLLRADLSVCESYRYRTAEPLDSPFFVLGGAQDRRVRRVHLSAWRAHTRGPFQLRVLPGDHFYIRNAQSLLAPILRLQLRRVLDQLSRGTIEDLYRAG